MYPGGVHPRRSLTRLAEVKYYELQEVVMGRGNIHAQLAALGKKVELFKSAYL